MDILRRKVEDVVYAVLADIGVPAPEAVPDAELLEIMFDEDAASWFVPQVERLLNVKITTAEWEYVRTVSETIDMLERHLRNLSE
jgi:hypothetical protein